MTTADLESALAELASAEEFLAYFGVEYEPSVVHVNRLHILQRFHDYLAEHGQANPREEASPEVYKVLLERAYQDFVTSDAQTEKVFQVFRAGEPQQTFVPLDQLMS